MGNMADVLKGDLPSSEDALTPEETPDIAQQFDTEQHGDKPAETPADKPAESAEPTKPIGDKPADTQPTQVPWKALKSEREKRQKLEAELAYLRGRIEGQPQPKDDGPSDDDLDNEFLLSPSATLNSRVESKVEKALRDERANVSDAIMRATKEDYPELLEEFAELARSDPRLLEAARKEPMPAMAIYNFMKEKKNPPQRLNEEELKAKWRKEWEEEQRKKESLEEIENTAPSPAGTAGSGAAPAEKAMTVDDLFKKRKRVMGI